MVVGLAVAFPGALVALLALALSLRDGQARTEVQELAFQAADAAVAARNAEDAQAAAQQVVQLDRDQRTACWDPHVRLRDPTAFRAGGVVDIEVRCDLELWGGTVVTYAASAKRLIDPYREVGDP